MKHPERDDDLQSSKNDHTLAAQQKKSMQEKAKGAVAQMEKLIKTAKTPEMKQKYEAVLAKLKQHHGLA